MTILATALPQQQPYFQITYIDLIEFYLPKESINSNFFGDIIVDGGISEFQDVEGKMVFELKHSVVTENVVNIFSVSLCLSVIKVCVEKTLPSPSCPV